MMGYSLANSNRLPGDQSVLLLEQFALAIEFGVPLHQVVDAMAESTPPGRQRRLFESISQRLHSASSDADKTSAHPQTSELAHCLPARLHPLLELGSRQGCLPQVLRTIGRQEASRQNLRRRLRTVLAYPAIVLGLLLALFVFISVVVVPPFAEIYYEFQLELPAATATMLSVSSAMPQLIGAATAIAAVVLLGSWWPPLRRWSHWLRTAVPLLGRAWIWSGHEQLAQQMGALTSLNLTIDQALLHAAEGQTDRYLAAEMRRLASRCRQGSSLGSAMACSRAFERSLTATVAAGEAEQALPEAWEDASQDYAKQLEMYTKFLARVTPPILAVFVASVLSGLVFALFMPLVSLIEFLS